MNNSASSTSGGDDYTPSRFNGDCFRCSPRKIALWLLLILGAGLVAGLWMILGEIDESFHRRHPKTEPKRETVGKSPVPQILQTEQSAQSARTAPSASSVMQNGSGNH